MYKCIDYTTRIENRTKGTNHNITTITKGRETKYDEINENEKEEEVEENSSNSNQHHRIHDIFHAVHALVSCASVVYSLLLLLFSKRKLCTQNNVCVSLSLCVSVRSS